MRGAEDPVPREIRDADLVLVAGLARARTLARELSNRVVPTGLPVLDDVLSDRATCRRRVRQRLGLSEEAQVVVLDPGFDPASSALVRLGDGIVALSAIGLTLLVPCSEDMGSWGVQMAQLGRHLPSLHVEEGLSLEDALAASDVIVGSTGPFTRAGAAMGWPVALVDPAKPDDGGSPIVDGTVVHAETLDEILSVVPSLLTRSEAPSSLGADLLRRGGGAAERAAEAILEGWSQKETPPEEDPFSRYEALAGFGRIDEAVQQLSAHLERSPNARGLRLLASFHRKEGRLEAAEEATVQGERVARTELGHVLCERGRVAVDSGHPERARPFFEGAREVAPDLAEGWLSGGSLDLAAENPVAAEEGFRQALRRDADSARARAGLGLALLAGGKPGEALEALEGALDLDPGLLPAIFGVVQAAFQTGELARSERRVGECLAKRPGNVDLAFTLAGIRLELGDREGASEMVDRVELFRPDYPSLADLRTKLAVDLPS